MVAVAATVARLRPPLATAVAAATAVGVVALVDPNEPGHYPTCPFLELTGLWCPGCGSLRAVHALSHGELGTAVGLNVLTVLAVPAMLVIWLRWVRRARAGTERAYVAGPSAVYAVLAVIVVFGVLRNLPVTAVLAP